MRIENLEKGDRIGGYRYLNSRLFCVKILNKAISI